MKYKQLGQTGLYVSEICLGTMTFTGDNKSAGMWAAIGDIGQKMKTGVFVEFFNRENANLGMPLPKGRVRVYKADTAGSQQLIGEDWIDHTPKDEKLRIKMGEAFDVVGQRTQKEWKRIASNLYEVEWEISLRNHKQEAVTVDLLVRVTGP